MDTACALTFVAHGFYGIEAMIGDYVPLIAPLAVAKVNNTSLRFLTLQGFTDRSRPVGSTHSALNNDVHRL